MSIVINRIEYTNVKSFFQSQVANLYFAKKKNEDVVIKEQSLQCQEINILENLISKPPKNFVKIIDCDRKSYIVMEKGDGTLSELFLQQEFTQLNLLQKIKLFQQIVNGIQELHSRNMIHRDLKPDNIIYFQQKEKIILKIIDTGQMFQLSDRLQFLAEIAGTENFRAPEYFQQNVIYNQKVDVWALGLIFYQMITNQNLIKKRKQILDQQYIKSNIESIEISNDSIQELISQMLEQSHHQRWNSQQIKLELKRIIENIELKEEIQQLRKQYTSLDNNNQSLQNQIQSQSQKIQLLNQKLQESIKTSNDQAEAIQNNQTQLQIVQETNSNLKIQISQQENKFEQLKTEYDKKIQQISNLLEEKMKILEQNQNKEKINNQNQIEQLTQLNKKSQKHKRFVLLGHPGAGKTWIYSKIQGQNVRFQNVSTTQFLDQFINEYNLIIVDSPAFLDQSSYDEREATYSIYDSYFKNNQIDDIIFVVQYQRTDLMKSEIKQYLKYFKTISSIIVTMFNDTESITQIEQEQLRNQLSFCNSTIYFTNKNSAQKDILDILYQISISKKQKQTNFKDIFTNYVN